MQKGKSVIDRLPIQEFEVRTASGRNIIWGSTDAETCRMDAIRSGHCVISIWPYKERYVK